MEKPQWVTQTPEEIESAVVELHKEGNSTALIGLKLRDSHGIPNVKLMTGKSITEILAENDFKFKLPEDISNLMRRAVGLSEHLMENPKDLHNKRAMQLTEAKIRRLERYYKKTGIIPEKWKYSITTAKLEID
jgi:small subunit ribosomal protein S15